MRRRFAPRPNVRVMLSANGLAIAGLGLMPQMLMSVCAYAMLASM